MNMSPELRHITDFTPTNNGVAQTIKVGGYFVWVPARAQTKIPSLWRRFKLSYGVFTGRYDALSWEDKP